MNRLHPERRHPWLSIPTALVMTATLSLTGCSADEGKNMETQDVNDAKGAIVAFVDESSSALGGDWRVSSGPAVESCDRDGGGEGAAYGYLVAIDQPGGDPEQDIASLERLWTERGLTTERYQSGGSDPVLGIRGSGGSVATVDFLADPRRYSIDSLSSCVEGDAAEMQNDGE
jgi:hypothetical protein